MKPFVSVITPCYNHGIYLDEATNSIPYKKVSYEIEHIIINDGSTDEFTIHKLNTINNPHIKIIHQSNKGLSEARNIGIEIASGKYIIPLDADNKLHENYFTKAIDILEADNSISVVYGDMHAFENESWINRPGEFDIIKTLQNNYIDACAVFKKQSFQEFGLYDVNKLYGYEDWDLWINFYFKGAKFFYLSDIGFWYRVTNNSMLRTIGVQKFPEVRSYILKKYSEQVAELLFENEKKRRKNIEKFDQIRRHPVKSIMKLILGIDF